MSGSSLLLFAGGLVLLIVGAEGLVRGSVRLAAALGVSPLIIGLTVVAFGTSSPEVLVSAQAALYGQPAIALGNVIGSNIFNVLFILGLSSMVSPLIISEDLVRHDVPVMIGVSSLVMLLAMNGTLGKPEGVILLLLLVIYIAFLIWLARRSPPNAPVVVVAPRRHGARGYFADAGLVLGGLGLLAIGSRWLVVGSVAIARTLGLSELVIGLTIVAAGTSLPEVATSVTASLKG